MVRTNRKLAKNKPTYCYTQSGVIPWAHRHGRLQVLLISSRRRKRWIVPKGIVEPDLTPRASAAKEALEEAGVEGEVGAEPIGSYSYEKWGGTCTVELFPMRVTHQHERWQEDFRKRVWCGIDEAVQRVREPALRALLQGLPAFLLKALEEGLLEDKRQS